GDSNPSALTVIGSTLYFSADNGTNGVELWKSDGTESGTMMVKNINSGSSPANLTVIGSTLYFTANDGTNGVELWKSDGTEGGTTMVQDIYSGATSSNPAGLVAVGDILYFRANTLATGFELWKSDGTESGTTMVKDIHVGSNDSAPDELTNVNGILYFNAEDATYGTELWKYDTAVVAQVAQAVNTGNLNNKYDRLFKHYKKKYKNAFNKSKYDQVRLLKRTNPSEFERLKTIYHTYRSIWNKDRSTIAINIQADYELYKKYRGYKLYRYYKKRAHR
ncbi:MAG TPA: ELWxxDGT repeat protein, partial [Patescibacteria group bacterium]|nr:ELWxxDGT repeat protein [Patescibacteria group bacterium]